MDYWWERTRRASGCRRGRRWRSSRRRRAAQLEKRSCPPLEVSSGSSPGAPGDYENWEGTLIKLGEHNINLGGINGQN